MKIIDVILSGLMEMDPPSQYISQCASFEFLEDLKHIEQRSMETTFQHTMNVLDCLTVKNPITLLSALFHDIGKSHTKTIADNGKVNFWGHELVSVDIAFGILPLWGTHPNIIDCVTRIIKTHMVDIKSNISGTKVRRFVAEVGYQNIDNWFVLRRADARSYQGKKLMDNTKYQNSIIDPFQEKVNKELSWMYNGVSGSRLDPSMVGDEGMTVC